MSMVEEQAAFLLHVSELVIYATRQGFTVTGGELYRSAEQQKIYVETGRSMTMNSNHLRRLAIDLNFFLGGKLVSEKNLLRDVGTFWENLDAKNRWGGNFKNLLDTPHFERNV